MRREAPSRLSYGLMKQSFRSGCGLQVADARAAGRFSKNRDVVWIASKGFDVVTHPAKRSDLIEQTLIPICILSFEPRVCKEP